MKYPSGKQQLENLKNLKDGDIDYSDILPIIEDMLKNAVVTTHKIINGQLTITSQMHYLDVIKPRTKERLHARIDSDVLECFKQQGKGYQTHINAVLRAYYQNNHHKFNMVKS